MAKASAELELNRVKNLALENESEMLKTRTKAARDRSVVNDETETDYLRKELFRVQVCIFKIFLLLLLFFSSFFSFFSFDIFIDIYYFF